MAAFIRPSLILGMDIDEREFSEDMVAEIKRSYSYVAPSVVSAREIALPEDPEAPQPPIENVIRLSVRLHKPYWDPKDPDAQELWTNVMPKWLHNMIYKVSSTITAVNKVRGEKNVPALDYAWVEFEFPEKCTVAEATNIDSSIPEECIDSIETVRNALSEGVWGEGVVRVSIPSEESYRRQCDAAIAASEEAARAEEAAAAMAYSEAMEEEELDPTGGFDEKLVAQEEIEESADDAATTTAKLPPFEVDRSEWGIVYADGTVRSWDSTAGAFV